jgi:hypothetical protein
VGEGESVEVEVRVDVDGRGGDTEPAGHLRAFPVEARQQQPVEPAAQQVVVDLEGERALARAHRAEAEAQAGHDARRR